MTQLDRKTEESWDTPMSNPEGLDGLLTVFSRPFQLVSNLYVGAHELLQDGRELIYDFMGVEYDRHKILNSRRTKIVQREDGY